MPKPVALMPIPAAAKSIQKGSPLKLVLGSEAIACLGNNLQWVDAGFDQNSFSHMALNGLDALGIMERGNHIAKAMRQHLPQKYASAIDVLLASLTPVSPSDEKSGLAAFFYLPHLSFIALYGQEAEGNGGEDPFEVSMHAQHELTSRFSAEFSIRPFLIRQPERTLAQLHTWSQDPDKHVRRLCSEGTRPRLPWASRIPAFIADPSPTLPILERLKEDSELYVRRSVANHVGDIAKDHPEIALALCERWLTNASSELKWLIRHALRHPAKKGNVVALQLRTSAH